MLLMVKPGLDLIRIVFALFKIGAVPVVIDPGMGLGGFLRCVQHSRPEVLVGLPLAVWLAFSESHFASLQHKLAVGRSFYRRIRDYSSNGAFAAVDSEENDWPLFCLLRFNRTCQGCVLYAWYVCCTSGDDS